jgi:hypothetical protein
MSDMTVFGPAAGQPDREPVRSQSPMPPLPDDVPPVDMLVTATFRVLVVRPSAVQSDEVLRSAAVALMTNAVRHAVDVLPDVRLDSGVAVTARVTRG